MSISATLSSTSVASLTAASSSSTTRTDPKAAFEAIGKALDSGDVSAAQAAVTSFQSAIQSGRRGGPGGPPPGGGAGRVGGRMHVDNDGDADDGGSSTSSSSSTKFDPKAAFDSLSKALQSGDITAAKQVYATLQAHQPGAKNASSASSSSTSTEDPFAESSGSTLSIQA